MQKLCSQLRVPCAFLRMIVIAIIVGVVAHYYAYGIGACFGLALLSLLVMQVVYFLFVLLAVWQEKRSRQ